MSDRIRYQYNRPSSVTVICVLLLIRGLFSLVLLALLLSVPEIRIGPFYLVCDLVAIAISLTCAIFMRIGANWARILFFAALVPEQLVVRVLISLSGGHASGRDIASMPGYIVGQLVMIFIVGLLLCSEDANRYFAGRSTFFKKRKDRESTNPYRNPRRGSFDY